MGLWIVDHAAMDPMPHDVTRGDGALVAAASLVERLALGPMATSLAIMAVALTGLLMLSGRIDRRRASRVALGCFVVFGAPTIGSALLALATGPTDHTAFATVTFEGAAPTPAPPPSLAYDPYAGASVPVR